jgi:hypothetical protein
MAADRRRLPATGNPYPRVWIAAEWKAVNIAVKVHVAGLARGLSDA